jgi:hypothetical protein
MRPTPALLRLAVCLSSLAPVVLAWPEWLPARDSLIVRQDDGEDDSTSAAETGASATDTGASATDTGASATETGASETRTRDSATNTADDEEKDDGDLNTAKPTSKEDATRTGKESDETGTESTDKPKKSKSVPADAAVGAVNIKEPRTTAVPTALFKIGDNVTLSWNYTGIENEPTAVDVLLSCSTASETWTLTANMTFETEVNYIWDTREQEDDSESPLLTEMYTLIIKDSEAEISEPPTPGELGANSDFKFGLYHGVAYTPWPDWECTGCNSASVMFNVQVLKLAFTMCFITIMSFTWFATGWGLQ